VIASAKACGHTYFARSAVHERPHGGQYQRVATFLPRMTRSRLAMPIAPQNGHVGTDGRFAPGCLVEAAIRVSLCERRRTYYLMRGAAIDFATTLLTKIAHKDELAGVSRRGRAIVRR
jgi:hypothetical protein